MVAKSSFVAWYFNEFKFDPLFEIMDGMAEDSPWHRELSIGIHTNMVVTEYVGNVRGSWDLNHHRLLGAFAAAFHDVGKPGACQFKWKEERGDYKSFNGHEILSARLWEDWAVKNWTLLTERFNFDTKDIYRVGWLIEHHKPWDIKKTEKRTNMALTSIELGLENVFTHLLRSDTWGRLSDDAPEKRAKVGDWLDNFGYRVSQLMNGNYPLSDPDEATEKPVLVMPIGPSGCGKSTYRASDACPDEALSYSWDDLRVEWYSENYDEAYKLACEDKQFISKAHARFTELVKTGKDIYVDNTNTSAKRRRFFITEARRRGYYIAAILFPISIDTLMSRQQTRTDKKVPTQAVSQQFHNIQLPQYGEFDSVVVDDGNL